MSLLRPVLFALAALLPAAHAQDAPPTEPAPAPEAQENQDLIRAWEDLYKLRLGKDARWAEDTYIEDGLCTARLKTGVMVPVTSGRKVLDERPVGAVFFGEGELEVRFESREEALFFANHMYAAGEMTREELTPIVALEEPYRTPIDRAVLFTADDQLGTLMRRLDPVGGGFKERDDEMVAGQATERGVDAEYVVTGSKGEIKAKLFSRNLLPDRRRALTQSGMDPGEALQFDRMVHDAWGVPWNQLRMIMEFRSTKHNYHPGHGKRQNPYLGNVADTWLSCFRDGTDHLDSGLRAQVFSHAVDNNNRRFLTRFSTQRFFPGDAGPLPPMRVEPVSADVEVEIDLIRRMDIDATVTSRLRVRALEDGVAHVLIRTPRDESFQNTALSKHWQIQRLALVTSGRFDKEETTEPLAFMGLGVSGAAARVAGNLNTWQASGDTTGAAGNVDAGAGPSTSLGGGATGPSSIQSTEDDGGLGIFNSLDNTDRMSSYALSQPMGLPQELIVALPTPLAKGEEITIAFDWKARWPFGNFAVVQGAEANAYRPLGATTGARSFLPRFLPEAGGNRWDYSVDVTVPPRRLDVAVSGDTTDTAVDEGGWMTISSSGRRGRAPSVAIGRWTFYEEQAEAGMPGVKSHFFKSERDAAEQTPQQVRQTLEFMRRFMPLPDALELEVFQGATMLPRAYLNQPRRTSRAGLIELNTVKVGDKVTEAGTLGEFSFLSQKLLARGVVSQVWGQRIIPASARDAWISDALTEAFSFFYVRAALSREENDFAGFAEVENQLEEVRHKIETGDENFNTSGTTNTRRRFLSLTDGGSFSFESPELFRSYSFYVLGRMLRERVGDFAFFAALDQLGQNSTDRRVTTEDLRTALENTSGQDLEDFFAYWVRGGYVPEVMAEYRRETQPDGRITVHGCITTDVPFGRLDLPIAVGTGLPDKMPRKKNKAVEVRARVADEAVGGMIEVVDGRAAFVVPDMQAGSTVLPDPFGLILAYERDSKAVEQTTCEKEGITPRGYERGEVAPRTSDSVLAPPAPD